MRPTASNIRADVDPVAESVVIIGAMRGVSAQYLFGMSDASAKGVRDALVETLRRGLQRDPA
ncbi:hypothetical protein PO002_45970 [Cupriavidus necator]|uniref:hypothetical protein n=1 Tax=Cupriavidus necator TaxID=106590 RepID=UPI0039C2B96A